MSFNENSPKEITTCFDVSQQLSRLEPVQQQQILKCRRFQSVISSQCGHECDHSSNSNVMSDKSNGYPLSRFDHIHQHQHMHRILSNSNMNQRAAHEDDVTIYNNNSSSSNNECNQLTSYNDNMNVIHYVPSSDISITSKNSSMPNVSCRCVEVRHQQSKQLQHSHQRLSAEQDSLQQSGQNSRIFSYDENNPSGIEDEIGMTSSGITRMSRRLSQKNMNNLDNPQVFRSPQRTGITTPSQDANSSEDSIKYSSRMNIYSDSITENAIKVDDEVTSDVDRPPRLPPRPLNRPVRMINSTNSDAAVPNQPGVRKYVIWCLICGGILCLLGIMFLAVYFLLRSYTSTVDYFESVPPFVPATLLLLTGLCVMSLAMRRNRNSYLMKLSGACCLASALTCATTVVTTTVIHMSRLQALRECQYTQKTRTCTCSSALSEVSKLMDNSVGVRFVFDATADCSVVHGALYSCLRAVFGLSVAGVFVAVFSCMLVYQLLSHERKKMYWEQLELRCRSLYSGSHSIQPPDPRISCHCCHGHRVTIPSAYPWDGGSRLWPGQAGNFYSPNPGGDGTEGVEVSGNGQRIRTWNWPRMPWQNLQRNEPPLQTSPQSQALPAQRFHGPQESDSQYGFSNDTSNLTNCTSGSNQNSYSVIGGPYIWGPPPPYSNPKSPVRRCHYQYIQSTPCHSQLEQHNLSNRPVFECHQHHVPIDNRSDSFCQLSTANLNTQQLSRSSVKRQIQFETRQNHEKIQSEDSDVEQLDSNSSSLPVRKRKKTIDPLSIKSANLSQSRVTVQKVRNKLEAGSASQSEFSENEYNEPTSPQIDPSSGVITRQHPMKKIAKLGIENTGFQPIEPAKLGGIINCNTESEVYFGDVSSCCNTSLSNDNCYMDEKKSRLDKIDADDYLSQRFGNKGSSIRSRLPFPQTKPKDLEQSFNKSMNIPVSPAHRSSNNQQDSLLQNTCSSECCEKTDLQSITQSVKLKLHHNNPSESNLHHHNTFVATFPYNEQSQEAHRRSTKNLQDILSHDAQYETVSNQIETTPLNFETNQNISSGCRNKILSPKVFAD